MKRILGLFLALAMMLPLTLLSPLKVLAATQVYADNQAGWEAAVGDWLTEDFQDAVMNPGLSVNATWAHAAITGGVWYDRLINAGVTDSGPPYQVGPTTTTWTFTVPIYAFGGTWDLAGPGGPGASINVNINGSWVLVGMISRLYADKFWGFVSDVPFTQVRLISANDTAGWCETYELDNLVYTALPQRLTGGGQIVAGEAKRNSQHVVSFAGILGYTGDQTLMGQYQYNFHNVSVDALDGAVFHSTSVSILTFSKDSNAGPTPPPAEANVAYYSINGRLKMKDGKFVDGYTIFAMVADRGEPGKNDSINFALWQGATNIYSSTWDFPCNSALMNGTTMGTKLINGNLQIHADYLEMVP